MRTHPVAPVVPINRDPQPRVYHIPASALERKKPRIQRRPSTHEVVALSTTPARSHWLAHLAILAFVGFVMFMMARLISYTYHIPLGWAILGVACGAYLFVVLFTVDEQHYEHSRM